MSKESFFSSRDRKKKTRLVPKKTRALFLTVRRVVVHARRARLLDALAAVPARVLVHADALFLVLERAREGSKSERGRRWVESENESSEAASFSFPLLPLFPSLTWYPFQNVQYPHTPAPYPLPP